MFMLKIGDDLELLLKNLFKPVVLYNNSTGTTGTVTLSETSANFSTIKIFYRSSGGGYNSVEIFEPNGKQVYLITNAVNPLVSYYQNKLVEINGISITNINYNQNAVGTGSVSSSNDNNNRIIRVVGYKA